MKPKLYSCFQEFGSSNSFHFAAAAPGAGQLGANTPGGGQPATPPPENLEAGPPQKVTIDFHRFADIYLGGLWNRFEAELRRKEGDAFE